MLLDAPCLEASARPRPASTYLHGRRARRGARWSSPLSTLAAVRHVGPLGSGRGREARRERGALRRSFRWARWSRPRTASACPGGDLRRSPPTPLAPRRSGALRRSTSNVSRAGSRRRSLTRTPGSSSKRPTPRASTPTCYAARGLARRRRGLPARGPGLRGRADEDHREARGEPVRLTADMRAAVLEQRLGYHATVSPDGRPRLPVTCGARRSKGRGRIGSTQRWGVAVAASAFRSGMLRGSFGHNRATMGLPSEERCSVFERGEDPTPRAAALCPRRGQRSSGHRPGGRESRVTRRPLMLTVDQHIGTASCATPGTSAGIAVLRRRPCRHHPTPDLTSIGASPGEAAGAFLRVGSQIGHHIPHGTCVRPEVVTPSRSGGQLRDRAAPLRRRLYATASVLCGNLDQDE